MKPSTVKSNGRALTTPRERKPNDFSDIKEIDLLEWVSIDGFELRFIVYEGGLFRMFYKTKQDNEFKIAWTTEWSHDLATALAGILINGYIIMKPSP